MTAFTSIEAMRAAAFKTLCSAQSMSVVEAAERHVIIRRPGAFVGHYDPEKTPYLREPQEVLTSLDYDGMVFVGPARTGKSQILLNWLAHTSLTDPTDMMVVHMAQHTGREWSKSDLDRMLRDSPDIKALLTPGRANDNTFDKAFLSGMRLTVTWPTANNLSGKTIRFNWLMDYDRMADSIDGEGNAFDLTKVRARTFGRFGMTVAESSPNPDKELRDPNWRPRTPHEAPPISGIFELYNRGDRRRLRWRCPDCKEPFEPTFDLLNYPDSEDLMESAEMVTLRCPNHACGFDMLPEMKQELNLGGRWVREGMVWLPDGSMVPRNDMKPTRSNIASFWMQGPAAAMQDWSSLVLEYRRAQKAYEQTGDEEPLKKTVTTDQGSYFISRARLSDRSPEDLRNKAEDWGATQDRPTVPHGVRFLIATVDVQARAFVVQIHGFTAEGDMVIIDGFKIRKSVRVDSEGDPLPVDPASYAEDWDMLKPRVIDMNYPLADGSGWMKILETGCDSGGRDGVTFQAYGFWRRLKEAGDGDHRRFALVKGDGSRNAPRVQVTWPDSNRRDKYAVAKGDVPVVRFNADMLKDQISGMLGRRVSDTSDEGGMIRFASWFEPWLFTQLTTEVRTAKGWENPGKRRNEAWDLAYYALGLALRPRDTSCPLLSIAWQSIDWDRPPGFARLWPENDYVVLAGQEDIPKPTPKRRSFAELAEKLA